MFDHRAAGVGAVEGAVPGRIRATHRFDLVLADRGRSGNRAAPTDGSMRELMGTS